MDDGKHQQNRISKGEYAVLPPRYIERYVTLQRRAREKYGYLNQLFIKQLSNKKFEYDLSLSDYVEATQMTNLIVISTP